MAHRSPRAHAHAAAPSPPPRNLPDSGHRWTMEGAAGAIDEQLIVSL